MTEKAKNGRQLSPEDENSILLRNVGMYLRVHTASQPRTTPTWKGIAIISKVEAEFPLRHRNFSRVWRYLPK
jgi:hypothetical protein